MATSTVRLFDTAVLVDTGVTISQPVSMQDANTVFLTVVVIVKGGTSLNPTLEGSSDLSSWKQITTSGWTNPGAVGYTAEAIQQNVGYQYVRVVFTGVGSGTWVFTADLTTSIIG